MPLCPAGSLVWASDPARPAGFSPATWTELDPAKKEVISLFFFVVFLYFYIVKIQISYLEYPVFDAM